MNGRNPLLHLIKRMVYRYFDERIPQSAAELAYFLLFSIFPLLIFVNYVLSRLNLPVESILRAIDILPKSVLNIIEMYFQHLSTMDNSIGPLLSGIVLILMTLSRSVRSIMHSVADIYHIEVRRTGVRNILSSIGFSVGILLSIGASFVLLVAGKSIWRVAADWFDLPPFIVSLTKYTSVIITVLILLIFLLLLNKLMPNTHLRWREAWPGALFSLTTWIIVSYVFSFYVDNLSNYSRIYGSLAAIMVLMLWLYLISIILLMGVQLNHTLISMRLYRMEYSSKSRRE